MYVRLYCQNVEKELANSITEVIAALLYSWDKFMNFMNFG